VVCRRNTDNSSTAAVPGSVAMQFSCGGLFSNHFVAGFSESVSLKEFRKLANTWQRYCQEFVAYFLAHSAYVFTDY